MKPPVLKSTTRRRLAIGAVLLVPLLGACGFGAQTDQVYQAAVGVNDHSGDVFVLNAVIVSGTDGSGTFAGTLVNKTDDVVQVGPVTGEGITSETGGGETLEVPANGHNNLGAPGETVPPAKLTIAGAADAITPGKYVKLVFTFSAGPSVTLTVPVVDASGDYADVPLPAPAKDDKTSESAESDASTDAE
ncbi:hypothetical protein EFK50_00335 [Nocardioides marmoriginsengisoli]|uniref:Copper chaperone PCu(A)C n=1 Tax=Nocardioides marmoriginsengisoli TaxID=661483 RepID=A0A3N0CRP8_9ACTN|nr:hypothetical protein [Nocardioides marmoriginsengisoli]RNL66115.1 hypothetical protein EFK50_00335 [Nocardioides marmoriginsengisoli]